MLGELHGVELVVVGDGPQRGFLESRAVERGCRDRVEFAGALSRADVDAQLKAADVFVLNSRYEGFPHVALEAYAAGIPVVATAAAGAPEVVRHNVTGLLVPPGDVPALRQAVRALLGDAGLRERLVKAGRDLLGSYSVKSMVESTELLLLKVASVTISAPAGAWRG